MKNGLLSVVLLLSGVTQAGEATWSQELSNAKAVDVAWEDLEGAPVKKTITGDELKKLQRLLPASTFQGGAYKCIFHRDASFTLPSGRRVDLCFGCGIAREKNETIFDKVELKKLYVELLGKQPAQKNVFGEGY